MSRAQMIGSSVTIVLYVVCFIVPIVFAALVHLKKR
jgi:hypothetical protein